MVQTKHDRFKEVAARRTQGIIKALHILGNCSSPAHYEYTTDEIGQMFKAIYEAAQQAQDRFSPKGQEKKVFEFNESE